MLGTAVLILISGVITIKRQRWAPHLLPASSRVRRGWLGGGVPRRHRAGADDVDALPPLLLLLVLQRQRSTVGQKGRTSHDHSAGGGALAAAAAGPLQSTIPALRVLFTNPMDSLLSSKSKSTILNRWIMRTFSCLGGGSPQKGKKVLNIEFQLEK